jgi:hypothetical protein
MRIRTVSIVIGPLVLAGALPVAGQSKSPDPQIQLTTNGNSTVDRDSYTQNARDEMREWRQKLRSLGETVKVNGQQAGAVADSGLNAAWIKTRAAEHKLHIATAADWEFAKVSFEKADRELADAWDKARPLGK